MFVGHLWDLLYMYWWSKKTPQAPKQQSLWFFFVTARNIAVAFTLVLKNLFLGISNSSISDDCIRVSQRYLLWNLDYFICLSNIHFYSLCQFLQVQFRPSARRGNDTAGIHTLPENRYSSQIVCLFLCLVL